MTAPVRLQLSRRKGFDLQALSLASNGLPAVSVARPHRGGNPFTVAQLREIGMHEHESDLQGIVVETFEHWLKGSSLHWMGEESDRRRADIQAYLPELRGKNLACWCGPDQPCHADVELDLANRPICEEA